MKTCSVCKIAKSANAYHKRAKSADGLQFRCKDCARAADARRYADPVKRERLLQASREWNRNHLEVLRERNEQRRRQAGVARAQRLDPEAVAKECPRCLVVKSRDGYGRAARASDGLSTYCIECLRAMGRAAYERNPERYKRQARDFEQRYPDRVRAWQRVSTSAYRARKLAATVPGVAVTADSIAARWAMWGDSCYLCGTAATETDHVVPLSRGGLHVPANLRPICRSCNASKNARALCEVVD